MERRCRVNFQWPSPANLDNSRAFDNLDNTVLEVGAGGGCFDIVSLVYHLSLLSPLL